MIGKSPISEDFDQLWEETKAFSRFLQRSNLPSTRTKLLILYRQGNLTLQNVRPAVKELDEHLQKNVKRAIDQAQILIFVRLKQIVSGQDFERTLIKNILQFYSPSYPE
eukprot:TRINITY_DN9332_c0_g1_i5.p1 TRINITY_DN9332_c0_g1~~TRINITY_DN9332_c0_g1_i5.p1  ORF type:complete len:109 (-),score=26.41 TRINITY_DN9332_c0_g1_i5:196-522(-)